MRDIKDEHIRSLLETRTKSNYKHLNNQPLLMRVYYMTTIISFLHFSKLTLSLMMSSKSTGDCKIHSFKERNEERNNEKITSSK